MKRPGCGHPDCPCTHEEPCDRGWVEVTPNAYGPCRNCKPDLYALFVRYKGDREGLEEALRRRRLGSLPTTTRVL